MEFTWFCILSVDWRSSKIEHNLFHRTQNNSPKQTGKYNAAHK